MSQHFVNLTINEKPIEILLGWDKRTVGFFMVITGEQITNFKHESSDEDEGLIYSNLTDPALKSTLGMADSLEHFKSILTQIGVVLTEEITDALEEDKRNNVGNKEKKYAL